MNKRVLNESMPFLTLGGVFTQTNSVSDTVKQMDKQDLQRAIITLFMENNRIDCVAISELAAKLGLCPEIVNQEIYDIMASFWNQGNFNKNQSVAIDKEQINKGTKMELEHTDNLFIAAKIASDHLSEDNLYYNHLEEMEAKYGGD
jgi:hypothetical protein